MNLDVNLVKYIEEQLNHYSLTDNLSFAKCYTAVTSALHRNPTPYNYWGYVTTVVYNTIVSIFAEKYENSKKDV